MGPFEHSFTMKSKQELSMPTRFPDLPDLGENPGDTFGRDE